MAWGRGGAGNIAQAYEAEEKSKGVEDVEAQKPSATSLVDDDSASPPTTSSQTQQYAHKGRGGAGNWYSPAELSTQGTFTTSAASASASSSPSTPSSAASKGAGPADVELPTARTGRGGAGNFVWGNLSIDVRAAAAERAQAQREGELSAKVARDVEAGLARPGNAHLAAGGERRADDPAQVYYPAEAGLGL